MKNKKILKILYEINTTANYDITSNKKQKYISRTETQYDYVLDKSVKLSGKYLEKYNIYLSYKPITIHLAKLFESGFYEYQYKLKQYLSQYGINRIVFKGKSSNVHITLNNIILSSKLRNRFIQLMINYGNNNNFLKMIDTINSSSFELIKTIDTDEKNIFNHFIAILYKVLCNSGIRNTDQQNVSVLNFSINVHKLKGSSIKTNDPKEIQYMLYEKITFIFDNLVRIFNKYTNGKETEIKKNICYMDKNNMNNLTLTFVNKQTYNIRLNTFEIGNIVNINISMDKCIYKSFASKTPYNIYSMDDICFLNVYYAYLYDQLHNDIICSINDKDTIFKLDTAMLVIFYIVNNKEFYIYMNCFIYNEQYFIHDIYGDLYFKIDWRSRNIKDYYKLFTAIYLEDVKYIYHINITYYNTNLDYTYDETKCQPKR